MVCHFCRKKKKINSVEQSNDKVSNPTSLEANVSLNKKETATVVRDFIAVFLTPKSIDRLKSSTTLLAPSFDSAVNLNNLHVTLRIVPERTLDEIDVEERDEIESDDRRHALDGKSAKIIVNAIVQDDRIQTAIASVFPSNTIVDDSAIEVVGDHLLESENRVPHITLSKRTEKVPSSYSNVLLDRMLHANVISVEDSDEARKLNVHDWSGTLPSFDSQYDSTKAQIVLLEEPIVLEGVICSASRYNPDTGVCEAEEIKKECGFCVFMKAGPCGDEFAAWENCLEKCKKDNSDFIDHCGPETLTLRDCVDKHPEYYSILKGEEEDETSKDADKKSTMADGNTSTATDLVSGDDTKSLNVSAPS